MMHPVHGVVLAAGLASRMAAAKLELEIGGIPAIVRVVSAAVVSQLDRVILVVGPSPQSLMRTLGTLATHPKVIVHRNPDPARGMSGSLVVGIDALASDVAGAMILLGDQPLITPQVINRLAEAFRGEPDKIIATIVSGRRSNPVVFPASLFNELREVRGDVGGRDVVKRNLHKVVGIEVSDCYDDADLDTPEDLRRIQWKVMLMKRPEP
jgi:molybdenum cofactor cytidylyltransferase